MKPQYFILIISFVMLGSCKPKTNSSSGFDQLNMGNNTSKTNDNNSKKWSKTYWNKIFKELTGYAEKNNVPNGYIFNYVSCVITSLEQKFPNENVDPQNEEAQKILKSCESEYSNSQPNSNSSNSNNSTKVWSAADQQEFLDNCVPGASKSLTPRAGKDYCNCMLQKLMKEYPDSKDVSNASERHLKILATDCKNSVYD